jgi:hypothetical protein
MIPSFCSLILIAILFQHGSGYSAPNRYDEPMSESVVSFTRQTSQVTPYWLLQQLAAIDAVLIFKFADKTAYISYDMPAERTPRDDYLCRLFNDASDDFKEGYAAVIWDLIGLPRYECQSMNISEIKIPLHPVFSLEFKNGRDAASAFNSACQEIDRLPTILEFASPQHLQRIELEAIRDRIARIEQDQDARWKADYWAENKGAFLKGGEDTSKESGE